MRTSSRFVVDAPSEGASSSSSSSGSPGSALGGDYFDNHPRAARFPFTLYHRPIERSLARACTQVRASTSSPSALVFGCGLFHERRLFRGFGRVELVDVDARLEAPLRAGAVAEGARGGQRVDVHFPQGDDALAALPVAPVDLISAKEVIEHIVDARPTLRALLTHLKPGGTLWVSVPNYGDAVLPLLENTVLEWVARRDGFTRRHIHPNKYDRARLAAELREVGLSDVEVVRTPGWLALCATARRSGA